jgi:hypothetical protein
MRFCGIDLHSNNSVIVVTDETDKIPLSRRCPNGHGVLPPRNMKRQHAMRVSPTAALSRLRERGTRSTLRVISR